MLQAAAASAALVLATGCSISRPDPAVTLAASTRPYNRDIPLPAGFRIADQSRAESGPDRNAGMADSARHRYQGRAAPEAVHAFYLKQMPLVKWAPMGEDRRSDRIVMWFARRQAICTVTITNRTWMWIRRTIVEIVIAQTDKS